MGVIRAPKSAIVRVAVTQAEPAWLNLPEAVKKTCRLIAEAATNGASLITFPELWIPGYPAWIWTRPIDFDLLNAYMKNSLVVDSDEMATICRCAAQNNMTVVMSFSENDHHSLYISQCTIGADGKIKMLRRKMKPTHMERTIFGEASGRSLTNVVQTPYARVGGLCCWEHIQPLLKYHTFHQREEIHVAAWPPLWPHGGGTDFWSMSKDGCQNLSRTYAIESSTFVLHTTAVLGQAAIDAMGTASGPLFNVAGGGSSAIFGPDGRLIASGDHDGLTETDEGIIYGDLEIDDHMKARGFVDACGHYSRPDMLWLGVDLREKLHVRVEEDGSQPSALPRLPGDGVEKGHDPTLTSNGLGECH